MVPSETARHKPALNAHATALRSDRRRPALARMVMLPEMAGV
jgi:hypothetical protein